MNISGATGERYMHVINAEKKGASMFHVFRFTGSVATRLSEKRPLYSNNAFQKSFEIKSTSETHFSLLSSVLHLKELPSNQ